MALGTLLAAFPGRRRNPIDPVSAPLPGCPVGLLARRDARPTPTGRRRPRAPRHARRCRHERHRRHRRPSRSAPPSAAATPPATPPSSSASCWSALIALLATRGTNEPVVQQDRRPGRARRSAARPSTASPSTSSAHRGEWVVVNFFATWCTPCRVEHPELVKFAEEHEGDPVEVVSVAFSDQPEAIREFFAEQGGNWPVVASDTGAHRPRLRRHRRARDLHRRPQRPGRRPARGRHRRRARPDHRERRRHGRRRRGLSR